MLEAVRKELIVPASPGLAKGGGVRSASELHSLVLRTDCPVARDESLGGLTLVSRLDEVDLSLSDADEVQRKGRNDGMDLVLLQDCLKSIDIVVVDGNDGTAKVHSLRGLVKVSHMLR